jgi:hypothetical protein
LFRGRALLIVAFTVSNLPETGLAQFSQHTKVDIVGQANEVITRILLAQSSVELFDLALEGISVLWVKYPRLLTIDNSDILMIFKCISKSVVSEKV